MDRVKLGIQSYTCRDYMQTAEDMDKALAYIADFGCHVIQLSGIGPIEQSDVTRLVKKYDMDVCVTHKDFGRMRTDIDKLIDEHIDMDCDCIGLGCMPSEYSRDEAGVMRFAADVAPIASRIRERGLRFAYHTHDFEFIKLEDGRTLLDVMLETTDPDTFWFTPDAGWAQIAGCDPNEFLRKLRGRIKVAHFKDYCFENGKRRFIEIGKGLVDYKKVYETCEEIGVPYAVFEQDCDWSQDALTSCRESFAEMKKIAAEVDG